jgi:hypothetical protein
LSYNLFNSLFNEWWEIFYKSLFFHSEVNTVKMIICILLTMLIAGCGPSPAAIEKALAQTLAAQPTATFTAAPTNTTIPTNTALPTNTPKPTNTPAPTSTTKPSSTPLPTIAAVAPTRIPDQPTSPPVAPPQPTQAEELELDITIKVINKCPDTLTLNLVGPMTLKFVVPPGETRELQAARGTYTTTDSFGYSWTQDLNVAVWEATYCD